MYYYLQFSNDGETVRGVKNKYIQYAEIPYGVTKIGSFAFACCRELKEVVIPNSVTIIDSYAFDNCSSLESISIPKSVKFIEKDAFHSCPKLKSIILPNNLVGIGEGAFAYCTSLYELEIPQSVQEIGKYAFSDTGWYHKQKPGAIYVNNILYKIKDNYQNSIVINEGTKSIADGAFAYCKYLQDVIIPYGINKIGDGAFEGCASLKSIVIPDSVKEIGFSAFEGCKSLSIIHIPEDVSIKIGSDAFEGTKWLANQDEGAVYINDTLYKYIGNTSTTIEIKPGTKNIAPYAFKDCSKIQSVNIPESVTEIGHCAFQGCQSLKRVIIPSGLSLIGYSTFGGCTSLEYIDIPKSVMTIDESAFRGCISLQTLDIPKSVTTIEKGAFKGCTSLYSIDIPDSIIKIGEEAFDNTKWYNDLPKGVAYLNTVLYKVKGEVLDSSLIIKEGTICIADGALKDTDTIIDLILPQSIRSIGKYVFWNCKSLRTISSHINNLENLILDDSFNSEIISYCSLVVPSGTRWEYSHHPLFCKFRKIDVEH